MVAGENRLKKRLTQNRQFNGLPPGGFGACHSVARWDISLKLGAKVRRQIKHRNISYVQVIRSLAELRKFGGRDNQPKAYSIWDCTFI
jgi:hypothetical protein